MFMSENICTMVDLFDKAVAEAVFSLGRLHMGGFVPPPHLGGQVQGDKVLMGGLMRGDIDLMGGT